MGQVDGETTVILLRRGVDEWARRSIVRLDVVNQQVERITDYFHCPWDLKAAMSTNVNTA